MPSTEKPEPKTTSTPKAPAPRLPSPEVITRETARMREQYQARLTAAEAARDHWLGTGARPWMVTHPDHEAWLQAQPCDPASRRPEDAGSRSIAAKVARATVEADLFTARRLLDEFEDRRASLLAEAAGADEGTATVVELAPTPWPDPMDPEPSTRGLHLPAHDRRSVSILAKSRTPGRLPTSDEWLSTADELLAAGSLSVPR